MKETQHLCFIGLNPLIQQSLWTAVNNKSICFQGKFWHEAGIVVPFLICCEIAEGVTYNDGPIWHFDHDGQRTITLQQLVSHFTATVTSWKPLELQTDCSCCDFSFMRSGSRPGTLFFYFSWFQSRTLYFSVLFCNIKKFFEKKEADCDFGVWGWDCNCLLAGAAMLFLDSLF